jgi:hypothetical protein
MWNTFVYLVTFQWLFHKSGKPTPEEIIAASSLSLEQTERDLETSAEYVRKKANKAKLIQDDVTQLSTRAKSELERKDREAARKTMTDMIAREKDLTVAKNEEKEARQAHARLEEAKEEHRQEIKRAKEELEDLKVRGTTADARKRSIDRDSLKDVTEGVKKDVRVKETQADLETDLRKDSDKEFLDAAGSGSVEERLAQLERETK